MRSHLFTAAVALFELPLHSLALSLQDSFAPRYTGLDATCEAAYTQQINGCSSSDFQQGGSCSAGCVKGLWAITKSIQASCGNENFGDATQSENVIVCFLAGEGPRRVCPNNESLQTVAASSTPKASVKTTTVSQTQSSTGLSTQEETSTRSSSTIESEGTLDSTITASPAASTEQRVTSISPTASVPTASQTSSSTTSQPSRNNGSGGGSPFDQPSSAVIFSIPRAVALLTAGIVAAGLS